MKTESLIKKISARLFTAVMFCLVVASCDNAIYDGEGDCSINYRVRFVYDYNMKYADAFAHEVETVTLYLIDSNSGNVVLKRTESGDILSSGEYFMTINVKPGKYHLLAWCGTDDKHSFITPETSSSRELTSTLQREHNADGSAFVDKDIDRLFYGWLPNQEFSTTEGTYYYTVPLVKNTNSVRIALQHMSGDPIDKDKFEFTITDKNGSMNWDNSLLPDEMLTYYAWHKEQGQAGAEISDELTRTASYSAAVAEFTVARLMKDADTMLTIRNKTNGENVFSIRLIDYALLVKGFYNKEMSDQEYLDRQDEYNLVFFLDDGDRWVNTFVYINSWKVVLQETGI